MIARKHILLFGAGAACGWGQSSPLAAQVQPLPDAPHGVETSTEQGIQFSTIRTGSGFAYPGTVANGMFPAGSTGNVGYDYRISRTEITTGVWINFVNAYSTISEDWALFGLPLTWGGAPDPAYSGPGFRWVLNPLIERAADVPVSGVSWREAAMFSNFLHNNQVPTLASIQSGAYNISTFGTSAVGNGFTDQVAHSPGARFWIPTLDEWMFAAYFDNNRNGPGQGGWWQFPTSSDTNPVSGPVGVGQTNRNTSLRNEIVPWLPVAQYGVASPWGLYDMSGGAAEWIETPYPLIDEASGLPAYRMYNASSFDTSHYLSDQIGSMGAEMPQFGAAGLRIAATVPSPSTALPAVMGFLCCRHRRRW